MGICTSFTLYQEKVIQRHQKLFKTLGFSYTDEKKIAKVFFGADVDYSKTVSFKEFSDRFRLEPTLFCRNAFMLLDRDHSGYNPFIRRRVAWIC